MFGRKIKKENEELKKRIFELEYILCQNKHDYEKISEEHSLEDYRNGMCDIATTDVLRCRKCGKIKKVFKGYH